MEFDISTTTFSNLIESESQWNPNAYNKVTKDRGLLQINEKYHPEVSDECAFSAECAMRWGAQRIKDGYLYEWTPGNCYAYLKTQVRGLPLMNKIKPNSTPSEGSIAIFEYKGGVKHVALITEISDEGFEVREANYEPAKITTRTVSWKDKNLKGFYTPTTSP